MPLHQLYKIWGLSLIPAFLLSVAYIVVSTWLYVSDPRHDSDFAALPYIWYAHGTTVFLTGFIASVWIMIKSKDDQLALLILGLNSIGALLVYPLSDVLPALSILIFMNPLAFIVFALVPYISWSITKRRVKAIIAIVAIVAICITYMAISTYMLFSLEPPQNL